MSVFDKFLDAMRLNADDDEFYNEEYEYEEDYEEEKEAKAPARHAKSRSEKPERTVSREPAAPAKPQKMAPKITPISKNKRQGQQNGMEVCVIKPNAIEDEIEITETLLDGRTVVINMEGLSVDIAQRIIDFTSGSTFAMHGNLQKISNYIFLATPNGTDISGDIQNLMDAFDLPNLTR